MIGRMGTVLLATLLIPGVLVARAQTETPTPADANTDAVLVYERGEWAYDYLAAEPLMAFVQERNTNFQGTWITYLPVTRLPDGRLVPLTPCDDLAVTCVPIQTRATAAFEAAEVGDGLVLSAGDD